MATNYRKCLQCFFVVFLFNPLLWQSTLRSEEIIRAKSTQLIDNALRLLEFSTPVGDLIYVTSDGVSYRPKLIAGVGSTAGLNYEFPATLRELKSINVPVVFSGGNSQPGGGSLLPLGYLKAGGNVLSSRFHDSWLEDSMLCLDSRSPLVSVFSLHDIKAKAMENVDGCVQTGPSIIKGGKSAFDDSGKGPLTNRGLARHISTPFIRSFACISDSGLEGFGITVSKASLNDLSKILPQLVDEKKHICTDAVQLDYNLSAGMLVNGKLVAGSNSFLLVSAVAFVKQPISGHR